MNIFLDCGHGIKAASDPYDPGVCFGGLQEAAVVRSYVKVAVRLLEEAGLRIEEAGGARHKVFLIQDGTYDERHRRVAEWARQHGGGLYVQNHVNAGRGKYGLVRHDYRSSKGRKLAQRLAGWLVSLPGVTMARTDELYPNADAARKCGNKPRIAKDGSEDWGWWTRGWSCIDGIYPIPGVCGVVYEPGFLDSEEHAPLWTPDGIERVGGALASALIEHLALGERGITGPNGVRAAV